MGVHPDGLTIRRGTAGGNALVVIYYVYYKEYAIGVGSCPQT